jgi:hypothetical protein
MHIRTVRATMPRRGVWIVATLVAVWFVGLAVASGDDGAAHNGPHNVPGVIRAVDFNDGGSLVAYYATTPGNQGGYSGYRPDTDVDIANGPGGPYVISSQSDAFTNEWLKYAIEVSQAGWYRADYFARVIAPGSATNLVTLIDDRPLGATYPPVLVQDEFADVSSRSLYLGAGRHTLGILLTSPWTALDRIEITPAPAPLALTPRVMPVAGLSTEVVVADAVVTDAPFLADPTGKQDSTQAFADAFAAVSAYGGGTVFAPAGIYRFDGTITIPESTTLRGADLRDRSDPNQIGTLLLASFGEGDETAAPFISGDGCVRDLSIWYPSQGFTSDTVRPYPVSVDGECVLNLRLYNSYDGIATHGGNHHVADIVGTVLHKGLVVWGGADFSWLSNVSFGNETWKSAPRPLISNAPSSDEDRLALDTYTSSHVTGVQLGRNDGYSVYGIRVRDALHDVLVQEMPGDICQVWGIASKIDAQIEEAGGWGINLHYLNTDNVPGTENLGYELAGFRRPASATNFANVKDPPFSAAGDGRADDTSAIQAALDAIGGQGGGTVYLPQGQYRVSRLTVPPGTELRGPLGGEIHSSVFEVCDLLGYEGKNTQTPASDPAMITLSPHSGVRGFDIVYPEQGYGTQGAPVLPYPFTIRGTGSGVWVENLTVSDAYNLIDFATYRCDDHFVSGVEGAVLNTGIYVGGGAEDGRLERMLVSRGLFGGRRLFAPPGPAEEDLSLYMRQNATPLVFGECTRETTLGLDSFDVKVGWRMLADEGGCTDSTFWHSQCDSDLCYLFEGGDNLRVIGAGAGESLVSTASFAGSVDVYGEMSWTYSRHHGLLGGEIRVHNERSLTLERSANASTVAFADEGPSAAVDGSEFTKWVSATGGTNWLTVDLDQPAEIDRWVVRHAGIDGKSDDLTTNDFAFQVSDDGVTFANTDSVTDNTERVTDRPVSARGRFVRLVVTRGTQPGSDERTRICEFEVFGKEGWQFSTDAEGWAPFSDIASFAAADGKLEISSSGSQPTIVSPDNLNIPASKFPKLKVRMKNSSAQTSATLAFTTEADPTFDDAKSVTVDDVLSSPEYTDYYFYLADIVGWTGTLRQLRLTPIGGAGDVSIDSIALEEYPYERILVPPQSQPHNPRIVSRQP